MSHFAVAVITEADSNDNLEERIAEVLADYCEDTDAVDPDLLEFEEDEDGTEENSDGVKGYYVNPSAKWDWWVVGGRFSDMLKLRDGKRCDTALVSDLDTDDDADARKEALEFWKSYVDGDGSDGQDGSRSFWSPEYYRKEYGSAEVYADAQSKFWMRAVVTPDGEWHEVGEMGWFACSSETADDLREWVEGFHDRFVKPYGSFRMTVVDCHI